MALVSTGSTVRRLEWGPRRAARVEPAPWNGTPGLMLVDMHDKLGPIPLSLSGDDVAAVDWIKINET